MILAPREEIRAPKALEEDEKDLVSVVELLVDHTTLAAAVAEPEDVAGEFCADKRVEGRRKRPKHKATCKEQTTNFLKKSCVFMLSYVGLTIIVVGYSIIGGILFRFLEGKHEEQIEQNAVDLRYKVVKQIHEKTSKDIGTFSAQFRRNLSDQLDEDMVDLKQAVRDHITQFANQQIPFMIDNMVDSLIKVLEQNSDQNLTYKLNTTLKRESIEENFRITFQSLNANLLQTITTTAVKIKQNLTDIAALYSSAYTADKEAALDNLDIIKTFQLDTYNLVSKEGWAGVDVGGEGKWTVAGAILYAVTVITTIGYGNITPKTDAGKAVTMVYALFGIPLTVLCITNIGHGLAYLFRALYGGTFCTECRKHFFETIKTRRMSTVNADDIELKKVRKDDDELSEPEESTAHDHDHAQTEVPMFLCLTVMIWYIVFGAIMFNFWEEGWTIFDGTYYCFITLSTIGFGDIVPGFKDRDWEDQVKQVACSLYLLIGLSMLAMCFELIEQRASRLANQFAAFIGLVKKE